MPAQRPFPHASAAGESPAAGAHVHPLRPPQTNGHVERLHRTIFEECWSPAFARYVYVHFTGPRRDLEHYLHAYNTDRVHHGRPTQGRIPTDIVYGARKMAPA